MGRPSETSGRAPRLEAPSRILAGLLALLIGLVLTVGGAWLIGVDIYRWLRYGEVRWHTLGYMAGTPGDWVGLWKLVSWIPVGLVDFPAGLGILWVGLGTLSNRKR